LRPPIGAAGQLETIEGSSSLSLRLMLVWSVPVIVHDVDLFLALCRRALRFATPTKEMGGTSGQT